MPSFLEDHVSQIPALQLLQNLGYVYLRREEVYLERGGKLSNALLEGVLEKQLRRLNRINFKGADHEFSDANIQAAIQTLKDVALADGLMRANERIYDLISLGRSLKQTIDGDTKSFTLNYIDWKRPENNVFHVTEELEVERAARPQACRADIVLFVNGIPFAVIECDRPDEKDAIKNAVAKHLRNQQSEYIPRLFAYSQILLVINRSESKYATTGTPLEFWAQWRERPGVNEDVNEEVGRLVNKPLAKVQKDKLFADRFAYARQYFDEAEMEGRAVTEQDRAIYCLLRPERLIELTRQFIVFDAGQKKIARYQQYFAVKKTLEKIKRVGADGKRAGGVIWHTQGSGKSLTMVMMAKAIALEESVGRSAHRSGHRPHRPGRPNLGHVPQLRQGAGEGDNGQPSARLLARKKAAVITTVIDKFETAVKARTIRAIPTTSSPWSTKAIAASTARPTRGCGRSCRTPATSASPARRSKKRTRTPPRNSAAIIDAYTIDEAVRDKAVTPLLYEGRRVSRGDRPADPYSRAGH